MSPRWAGGNRLDGMSRLFTDVSLRKATLFFPLPLRIRLLITPGLIDSFLPPRRGLLGASRDTNTQRTVRTLLRGQSAFMQKCVGTKTEKNM